MEYVPSFIKKTSKPIPYREENISVKLTGAEIKLIRFEEKKESYIWVQPEEILFVKSADHYVKSLIQHGPQKKWMTRHSTLKDLLILLTNSDFIRLNKFYVINKKYLSRIDKNKGILYLKDGFSIFISHRISSYIIGIFRY